MQICDLGCSVVEYKCSIRFAKPSQPLLKGVENGDFHKQLNNLKAQIPFTLKIPVHTSPTFKMIGNYINPFGDLEKKNHMCIKQLVIFYIHKFNMKALEQLHACIYSITIASWMHIRNSHALICSRFVLWINPPVAPTDSNSCFCFTSMRKQ